MLNNTDFKSKVAAVAAIMCCVASVHIVVSIGEDIQEWEGEEDQKNQENFDETTKNVNAYDRKNSKHNSGYSKTEP